MTLASGSAPASQKMLKMAARTGRPKFSAETLERELMWRRWFPATDHIDYTQRLSDEDTELSFQACRAFMEDNMHIKVPGKGRVPLVLRDAQCQVLRAWIQNRYSLSLKARQVGFSTLVAGYTLWLTFGYPDRLVVMLSKTERESIKLLAKTRYNYRSMPEWVRERGPKLVDRTRQVMTFSNDSSVESLPSANDPARGEAVFLIVVDEWAFLPDPEQSWASIEATTDIGGRVIGISTAKGEGNFFHKLWLGSQLQTNNFYGIFHPWSAVDTRDQAWYDNKVRNTEPWQMAQEYPSTPEEAFVGSGNPVFDMQNLRKFLPETPLFTCDIRLVGSKGFKVTEDGPLSVFQEPDNEARLSYAIGADIAEGLEFGDFTVAHVICVNTGKLVAVWHGKIEADVFGEDVLPALGYYYRTALVAPEVNNHGHSTVSGLKRAKYPRIYVRRSATKVQTKMLETIGWQTSSTSKPMLVDELGKWLRETSSVPHERTIQELRSYARDAKGKMGGQPHDDCVMSLGIAVQAVKYAIVERIGATPDASKIKGTFAWWEKRMDGGEPKVRRRSRVNGWAQ